MNAVQDLIVAHVRDARKAIADASARVDALEAMIKTLGDRPAPGPVQRTGLDGWSAAENDLLRLHYPKIGAAGCHELLPHRSAVAIRTHCSRVLGVTMDSHPAYRKYWCSQCEARVTGRVVAACQDKFCAGKQTVIEDCQQ